MTELSGNVAIRGFSVNNRRSRDSLSLLKLTGYSFCKQAKVTAERTWEGRSTYVPGLFEAGTVFPQVQVTTIGSDCFHAAAKSGKSRSAKTACIVFMFCASAAISATRSGTFKGLVDFDAANGAYPALGYLTQAPTGTSTGQQPPGSRW